MNVLVVLGHPRTASLCGALADAYASGARAAGMDVERLELGEIEFDPDVHHPSPRQQPLEPQLERARQCIAWADHLVFVFPAWWGVGPARLKGFLDRVLLPDFAFREREGGGFEGLLRGRTAHLVMTMDMPPWVYRLIYRAPGQRAMARSALGFCGIDTTATLMLGPVNGSTPSTRRQWLQRSHALGLSLRNGARRAVAAVAHRALAWVRALRLQFYPMTWMAYTIGALGASALTGQWDTARYWLGYACLFFLEAATVFTNERFDLDSDRRNRHYGPFNGGSRVLVDGVLTARDLRRGTAVSLLAALVFALAVVFMLDPGDGATVSLALAALAVLALGYTMPPLKLSWRGLGELDVAVTHGPAVVLVGFLVQGGAWNDPFPWLVGLPILLAVMAAIVLAGMPDEQADRSAGKRTLVVRAGRGPSTVIAMGCVAAAPASALLLSTGGALSGLYPHLHWALLHSGALLWLLARDLRAPAHGRIDALLTLSLAHVVWFVVLPLVQLARGA